MSSFQTIMPMRHEALRDAPSRGLSKLPLRTYLAVIVAAVITVPSVRAEIGIQAKAVRMKEVRKPAGDIDEEWAYRFSLSSSFDVPTGPLVVQYRYWIYREMGPDGLPESDLDFHESTLDVDEIEAGGKTSVETGNLRFPGVSFPGGPRIRVDRDILQGVRARVWRQGVLMAEFTEKNTKAAGEDWPLQPPDVPPGAEAGSGPWLLMLPDRFEFAGMSLGTPAAAVLKRLRDLGGGKVIAKAEPLRGYPFQMKAPGIPGCAFGFDRQKKLALVEISSPDRVKLPGGLLLGRSGRDELRKVFAPDEAGDETADLTFRVAGAIATFVGPKGKAPVALRVMSAAPPAASGAESEPSR